MDRRSFLKALGLVATAPLIAFSPITEASPEEIKVPLTQSLFTREELEEAGFIKVEAPCFNVDGISYACSTYKLSSTYTSELVQDISTATGFSQKDAETEIMHVVKQAVLQELKKPNANGKNLRYILDVFAGPYVVDPCDFTPRRGFIVRGVFV